MLKKIFLVFVLCLIVFTAESAQSSSSCNSKWDKILQKYDLDPLYKPLIGLCDYKFKKKLWEKMSTNKDLGYTKARTIMFTNLDNIGGRVCGVYSGACIATTGIPDHRLFNTEHSWCQSWGATGKAKSDLHHLYPVQSNINSKRNNFPFCEVQDSYWEESGSYFGKSYSRTTCFEPPNWHKGELARSMMYFSVRYTRPIDAEQESFFRKWNKEYTVTDKEYYRNEDIFYYQGNKNPFVQYPEFAGLIEDF